MALPLLLCETFLKRSCRRAATVLAALIALAGVPVEDADARQAAQPAAHAAAPQAPAQPATAAAPHATPAAESPVETGHAAADPAHAAAAPAQPASAGTPEHATTPAPAAADAAHGQPPAHGPPAGEAHGSVAHGAAGAGHEATGGEHEPQTIWQRIGPYFNFLVLAGALYYFLRDPIAQYLAGRDQQIRGGLVSARETSDRATTQLAEIDRRLAALPGEIDALRTRGVAEIAAEEKRIQAEAEAERARVLDDMQRDVDMRVRVAQKMLTERAADLAVTLAAQRVRETITDADQQRLIDRYTAQVKDIHG
jgi:F0F1-type ATP synthase membrane subunit b/b'